MSDDQRESWLDAMAEQLPGTYARYVKNQAAREANQLALWKAAASGDALAVRRLLAAGANTDVVRRPGPTGVEARHCGCDGGVI